MIDPARCPSCLARAQAAAGPTEADMQAIRRAAWQQQAGITLKPEDVRDDWTRQALVNEANRLHDRGSGGGR